MVWLRGVVSVVLLMAAASAGAVDLSATVSVTNLQLVSSTRVGRTVFEYVYRINLANSGGAVTNVVVTGSGGNSGLTWVDSSASVASIAAGGAAQTADTITFRQNRNFPFSLAAITWSINGTTGGGVTGAGTFMLPFLDAAGTGTYRLVDPDNPGATPAVADTGVSTVTNTLANYSAWILPTGGVSGTDLVGHFPSELVYRKAGKIFAKGLAKTAVNAAPVQRSNLSNICHVWGASHDYTKGSSASNDWIVALLPDNTSSCNSPTYTTGMALVRATATATDSATVLNGGAPVNLITPVIRGDGVRLGFLTVERNGANWRLRSYNDNLTIRTSTLLDIQDTPFGPVILGFKGEPTATDSYFYIVTKDPAQAAVKLYRYRSSTDSITAIQDLDTDIVNFTNLYSGGGPSDETHYAWMNNGQLWIVSHTSTTPTSLWSATAGYVQLLTSSLTPTRVVFTQQLAGSTSLYSIPRTGGAATTLSTVTKPASGTASISMSASASGSERLFFTRIIDNQATSTKTYTAAQMLSNGTGLVETAGSEWSTWVNGPDAVTGIYDVQKEFLVTTSGSNVQIRSYDTETGGFVADLGVVLNSRLGAVHAFGNWGDKMLFSPSISRMPYPDDDVYFLNAGVANSILAIPGAQQAGVPELQID